MQTVEIFQSTKLKHCPENTGSLISKVKCGLCNLVLQHFPFWYENASAKPHYWEISFSPAIRNILLSAFVGFSSEITDINFLSNLLSLSSIREFSVGLICHVIHSARASIKEYSVILIARKSRQCVTSNINISILFEIKIFNYSGENKGLKYYEFLWFQNGGRILFATDDWFAVAENLLKVSYFHFNHWHKIC